MKTVLDVKNCCGCKACHIVCPQNAIDYKDNDEGFWEPIINNDKCVLCGLCLKHCPQANYSAFHNVKGTYAALHTDRETVMKSTSGGGMTAVAEYILSIGGIVYGTYLDCDDWRAKFKHVDSLSDIDCFRGSKYVQSDPGDSYRHIRTQLENNTPVLFVGVPCQVAGLYSSLPDNINTDNLYTIDILCHGTPSPTLFTKHIHYLEEKYGMEMKEFAFRDKSVFPNKTALKYVFKNKTKYVLGRCEPYFNVFISGSSYRNCCYQCKFAQPKRVGDITLGDYWGIRKVHPDFDNSLGVSLVLVNTEKGMMLMEHLNLKCAKSDFEKAAKGNGILKGPSEKATCRDVFYKDVNDIGYIKAVKKNIHMYPMIYNTILSHLPKKVISLLSKI